ncbi:MAG TPA: hypothetical protein VIM28_05390 [Solirubrobacterales bacterium]
MESDEPRDLGLVSDWLPSVADPVLHLERIEARKLPEMQVEHLVRAPLRFAAFHGWGTFLTPGLVAATTLISLGATAFLDRLCAKNWGAMRRLLERGMDI